MKKIISILLSILCFTMLFAGCDKKEETKKEAKKEVKQEVKEENEFLPYGFEFGMTYEEAKKSHKDIPELEDATANDGYYCGIELDDEAYIKMFELSEGDPYLEDIAVSSFSYSFNENKKLYEFMTIATMTDVDKALEHLEQLAEYFNKKTGIEGDDLSDGEATWETDDNTISIIGQKTESGAQIITVVHNKNYELK